jgi:hypothetical protein
MHLVRLASWFRKEFDKVPRKAYQGIGSLGANSGQRLCPIQSKVRLDARKRNDVTEDKNAFTFEFES